jgi:hypothetical protein
MVCYQVHLNVRQEIYSDFISWLETEHIKEVLAQPGFLKAQLVYKKGGALESYSKDIKVIYWLDNEESIKNYLSGPALKLREKGTDKFPGQYSAQREVWLEGSEILK